METQPNGREGQKLDMWERVPEWAAKIGALLVIAVAAGLGAAGAQLLLGGEAGALSDGEAGELSFDGCNVMGLNIHGCVQTYGDAVDPASDPYGCTTVTTSESLTIYLEQAASDKQIKAILLDIDSLGGSPQAAYEIEQAIKMTGKPTVAWIREYGDSAAYWIASAADTVVASPVSDVGSIGVTSSYVDNAKQNVMDGLTYNSLSTGKYKDIFNTDKPLTEDERTAIMRLNQRTLDYFIDAVANNRGISRELVAAMADGSSWLGAEAQERGLVDMLGTYPEVHTELGRLIDDEPAVCWPEYE